MNNIVLIPTAWRVRCVACGALTRPLSWDEARHRQRQHVCVERVWWATPEGGVVVK